MAKSKQKTHKASSKVFKVHKNGQITYKKGNGNHKTAKDSSKSTRQRRNQGELAKGMANRLRDVLQG
jgi:ribosomal protein L35